MGFIVPGINLEYGARLADVPQRWTGFPMVRPRRVRSFNEIYGEGSSSGSRKKQKVTSTVDLGDGLTDGACDAGEEDAIVRWDLQHLPVEILAEVIEQSEEMDSVRATSKYLKEFVDANYRQLCRGSVESHYVARIPISVKIGDSSSVNHGDSAEEEVNRDHLVVIDDRAFQKRYMEPAMLKEWHVDATLPKEKIEELRTQVREQLEAAEEELRENYKETRVGYMRLDKEELLKEPKETCRVQFPAYGKMYASVLSLDPTFAGENEHMLQRLFERKQTDPHMTWKRIKKFLKRQYPDEEELKKVKFKDPSLVLAVLGAPGKGQKWMLQHLDAETLANSEELWGYIVDQKNTEYVRLLAKQAGLHPGPGVVGVIARSSQSQSQG